MLASNEFLEERIRARRFFNLVSLVYPLVEWRLWPEYSKVLEKIGLPPEYSVLDLATGTGMLAGAFSERGHPVTGLDFADNLLKRAQKKFPRAEFRFFDLLNLGQFGENTYDIVCMGYLLHGLSRDFRRLILQQASRIARKHVLIVDYCCKGNWFVRLIEWIEGPNYPTFLADDRNQEFNSAGLHVNREERISDIGTYWFCTPLN
jgi:SAM-dependent methyltransferase